MNIPKYLILVIILIFFSCKKENQDTLVSNIRKIKHIETEETNYSEEIKHIKNFAKKGSYNQNIALMINYSLHSGKNRFFIVDLKKDSIVKKALVCHGSGKGKNTEAVPTVFSNISESHCTSLGMAVMSERAYSSWVKTINIGLMVSKKTTVTCEKELWFYTLGNTCLMRKFILNL